MPKLNYLSAIAFSTCLFGTSSAWGQDVKSIVERKNKERLAATKAGDITWYEKNTTTDFTQGDGSNSMPRAEAISRVKKFFASFHASLITQDVESIRITGTTARVVLKNHYVGKMAGSASKLDVTNELEELWVPVGHDYKMKHVEAISQKVLVDGKKK